MRDVGDKDLGSKGEVVDEDYSRLCDGFVVFASEEIALGQESTVEVKYWYRN